MNSSQKIRVIELLNTMQLALEVHMRHCHHPLKDKDDPAAIVHKHVELITDILNEPPRNRRASDASV